VAEARETASCRKEGWNVCRVHLVPNGHHVASMGCQLKVVGGTFNHDEAQKTHPGKESCLSFVHGGDTPVSDAISGLKYVADGAEGAWYFEESDSHGAKVWVMQIAYKGDYVDGSVWIYAPSGVHWEEKLMCTPGDSVVDDGQKSDATLKEERRMRAEKLLADVHRNEQQKKAYAEIERKNMAEKLAREKSDSTEERKKAEDATTGHVEREDKQKKAAPLAPEATPGPSKKHEELTRPIEEQKGTPHVSSTDAIAQWPNDPTLHRKAVSKNNEDDEDDDDEEVGDLKEAPHLASRWTTSRILMAAGVVLCLASFVFFSCFSGESGRDPRKIH